MALLKTFAFTTFPGARDAAWLWLVLGLLASATLLGTPLTTSREYQIKAVFLFNFAQFVEWPPDTLAQAQTPLVIGVLGDDPFGSALDDTVRNEKVGEHTLVIQRYRRPEDINTCHILFISPSESARLEHTLAVLKDRSVLTVCDADGFAARGVMIRFLTESNKIRLRINLGAVKSAGLTISSKLLRPAEIINGPNP